MPDAGAFDAAYGRLAALQPAKDQAPPSPAAAQREPAPPVSGATGPSRLLARLALMAPRLKAARRRHPTPRL